MPNSFFILCCLTSYTYWTLPSPRAGLSRGLSPFAGRSPARGPQRGAALSGDIDLELHEDRRVIALDHLETIPA
jgi:hypothetical protein